MEGELIEILIPEVELTITVTRRGSRILFPKKLTDAMNVCEGDKIVPLKGWQGDVYLKKASSESSGIECHKRNKKDRRLVAYSSTLTDILLEEKEHRALYLIDKQEYKGEDVYYICTKNNLYGRTSRFQTKRDNETTER